VRLDLVYHTVSRTFQAHGIIFAIAAERNIQKIVLVSKWRFDGSTGDNAYKQKFSGEYEYSDSDLFLTLAVPIQICASTLTREKIIFWENARPSSTRHCKPI
jgi:hypothetical protein